MAAEEDELAMTDDQGDSICLGFEGSDYHVKLRGALGGTTEPDLGSLGRLRVNRIDRGKAPLMAYIYSLRTNRRAGQGLLYKKE